MSDPTSDESDAGATTRIRIERLVPARLEEAAAALARGFHADPLFVRLAPREARRQDWMLPVMRANLKLAAADDRTYVSLAEDGAIAGVAALAPPDGVPLGTLRTAAYLARLIFSPAFASQPLRRQMEAFPYMRAWDAMHWKEPHWYVQIVGVDAPFQGRGHGRALMLHALELARADAVPVYLETQNEANLRFYSALGFETTETRRPVADGPPTWGMIARPELGTPRRM